MVPSINDAHKGSYYVAVAGASNFKHLRNIEMYLKS